MIVWMGEAFVPGTNIAADVTTHYPAVKLVFQVFGDGRFSFYGEVRNTLAGIHVTTGEGAGRTSIQAFGAVAATESYRLVIRLYFYIQQQSTNRCIRTEFFIEQKLITSNPTQTGFFCPAFFKYGSAVGKNMLVGFGNTI